MNLTPRASRALELAGAEMCCLGHPFIGSQHLLAGLYALGHGMQFTVLLSAGVTRESLTDAMAKIAPSAEATVVREGQLLGASAVHALDRADRGASFLSHSHVGTEHILIALLAEKDGGAARIFSAHGLDTVAMRKDIIAGCGWSVPEAAAPDA